MYHNYRRAASVSKLFIIQKYPRGPIMIQGVPETVLNLASVWLRHALEQVDKMSAEVSWGKNRTAVAVAEVSLPISCADHGSTTRSVPMIALRWHALPYPFKFPTPS